MANSGALSVTLPADLLAKVQEAVEDGEYASSSEIVRHALYDWSLNRPRTVRTVDELRRLCQEVDDHPGPGVPMDEVFDRLEAKYKAMAEAKVV
jgi:antitoxin ParD1/3/4